MLLVCKRISCLIRDNTKIDKCVGSAIVVYDQHDRVNRRMYIYCTWLCKPLKIKWIETSKMKNMKIDCSDLWELIVDTIIYKYLWLEWLFGFSEIESQEKTFMYISLWLLTLWIRYICSVLICSYNRKPIEKGGLAKTLYSVYSCKLRVK